MSERLSPAGKSLVIHGPNFVSGRRGPPGLLLTVGKFCHLMANSGAAAPLAIVARDRDLVRLGFLAPRAFWLACFDACTTHSATSMSLPRASRTSYSDLGRQHSVNCYRTPGSTGSLSGSMALNRQPDDTEKQQPLRGKQYDIRKFSTTPRSGPDDERSRDRPDLRPNHSGCQISAQERTTQVDRFHRFDNDVRRSSELDQIGHPPVNARSCLSTNFPNMDTFHERP